MNEEWMEKARRQVKIFLLLAGALFCFVILFAFTTGPFYLYHYLGTGNSEYRFEPETIIVLGGAPMPGESALIRCYFARQLAKKWPESRIIIAQLAENKQKSEDTDAWQMSREIMLSGIDSGRFAFFLSGHSTREEAVGIAKQYADVQSTNCVLVTSPEHMFRAVATFRKAGYTHVGGAPTFGRGGDADFRYKENKMGGRKIPVDAGSNLQIRYQVWNHLRYQLLAYREIIGYAWYRLRGWA